MATKLAQKKRMSPDERRLQLLDVAVTVFAAKGIGETKHADIARAAGVSVATTFVYFPTREALVQDVLAFLGTRLSRLMDWSDFDGLPVAEILNKLAWRVLAHVETHPDYMRLMLSWAAHFAPELRTGYLAFLDQELDDLTVLLRHGSPGKNEAGRDDARILFSACQALIQMRLDGESADKLTRFIRHTIDVVLAYRSDKTGDHG